MELIDMQTLEALTTVEVPVEALIKLLGKRRAIEFIKEITQYYDKSIIEIKKGTKILSVKQVEDEYSNKNIFV
jgi:hypothetical protein